jgi:hypothetical protein
MLGVGLVGLGVPLLPAQRCGIGRLTEMRGDPGRGQLLGHIPPPGAPLHRERDIATRDPDGRAVGGRVSRQGYLAVGTNSLLYSAVAVNARGVGAMVMSLAGPATFPSAAYAQVRGGRVSGPVRVMARGARPYDAQFCYRAFAGDIALLRGCRWGDYSAARADAQGRIWMAPNTFRTCPGPSWPTGAPSSAGLPALTRQKLPDPTVEQVTDRTYSGLQGSSSGVICAAVRRPAGSLVGGWR